MELDGNLPHAQYRRFEGMREFEELLDDMIGQTQSVIRIFDKSLSREYNSPRRYEALRHFLLASRSNRLMIVLHETVPISGMSSHHRTRAPVQLRRQDSPDTASRPPGL